MTIARLNGLIGALESGRPALSLFAPMEPDMAVALRQSSYDGVCFEGEHQGWDIRALRDSLQFLLDRGEIARFASLAPAITPLARVPANGAEMNQFLAKQALDLGCYGIMWPHVSTVAEAYNAVSACRYPRLKDQPLYEPRGIRGDGPFQAQRYWGVSPDEYYARADVWPLAPHGEILCVLQIEDIEGIANLRDILREVPGIGAIVIGVGDLSQELGVPRQTEHKCVQDAMAEIRSICLEQGVVVGHPSVTPAIADRVLSEGYRWLMCPAPRSFATVDGLRAKIGGRAAE
jgi:4-hydroxy-2-oxoheptanedioate aldolase